MKLPGKIADHFTWRDALLRCGIPEDQVDTLTLFVIRAANHELYEVNPRYLAEQLRLPEWVALNLLVTAVAEGLFTLIWQTTCPICHADGKYAQNLAEVDNQTQCHYCDHHFIPHLDDEISVTVTATAVLRPLTAIADNPTFRAGVDGRLGKTSALSLINIPAFRRLITDQQLPQGHWLGVKQLVIFFSDLRQSTAFYNKLGDAEAFHWVREHFRIMFAAVERYEGTAVKTIGDGIMGIFTEPENALNAIVTGMQGLVQVNDTAGFVDGDRLTLKVGMHQGACIVVTLNGRLDYFGETVNIAARLAGLSFGGDIILSQAITANDAALRLAKEAGDLLPLTAQLRGLPAPFDLHRLAL